MRNNDYFNDKKGDEADFAFLREQIYAGFLGMNIGIRLGAPVEPEVWTSERIRHYFMGMSISMLKIFICLRLMMIPTGLTFFLELCATKKPQSHATGCS